MFERQVFSHFGMMAGGVAGLSPVIALGQELAPAPEPFVLGIAAAIGGLFGVLMMAAMARTRLRRLALRHQRAQQETIWLEGLAAGTDAGCFSWRAGEVEGSCSPRLAEMIGLDPATPHVFGEVAFAFRAEHAVALTQAVEDLRGRDRTFAMTLITTDGRRTVEARGAMVGDHLGWAVWFADTRGAEVELKALDAIAEATVVERDRLQAVLDAAPFAIWQRDERGRLIWVNGAYARQVGLGRDEALRNGVELEPLGERGLAQALAARARESGATASERRLLAVEGEPRRFDVIECPVGGAGGTAGFALDASEAEDVQADLERQVAAQADLLDELDIGVAIWGTDRRLVYANGATARLWRVEPEWLARAPEHGELLERLRQNRRLPEQADFPAFKRARLALQDNLAQPVEGIDHLPDGTAIRWRVFASRLGGAVFTHADVTERFTLERDRASAVALQRATIDNLRTAVTVVGSDGRVKLFNPALARLSGLDSAVLARQPHVEEVVDLIRPLLPERDDWAETRRRRIAFALERRGREGQFALRDGRTLNWFQAPLPDGNSLFGFLDVTDSTRVEAALRGRAEALEAADRFKRAFLANAAYDLRTPITTIAGFAEMLLRRYFGELNPRQLDYARGILHSAETLNDLITDVIDLAGAEAGHVALETARLDLQELLADALEIQRNRATARGVVVDLDCALDIGEITGDVRRLRRALDRLVANAIDRTPPGEPVVVGAAKEGQQATLWIADGGPPLDEAEREGFFEPFAGATRESLRRPGGGAGLSLARRVVELHGGRAEVAHNADKGACVILRLPVDGPGSKIAP